MAKKTGTEEHSAFEQDHRLEDPSEGGDEHGGEEYEEYDEDYEEEVGDDGLEPRLSAAIDSGEAEMVASNSYDDYGMGGGAGFNAIYKWKRTYYAHIPESGTEKYQSLKAAFEQSGACCIGGLNQSICVDMKFGDLLAHYREACATDLPNHDPKQVFELNGVHCAIREGGSIITFEPFFEGKAVPTTGGPLEATTERIARRPDGRFCILIESEGETSYHVFEDLAEDEIDAYLKKRADGDAEAYERRREGLKRAMEVI